jgi:hypothetical protein
MTPLSILFVFAVASCSGGGTAKVVPPPIIDDVTSATIDTAGGTVKTPTGATISIPFGALDHPVVVQVAATTLPPPAGIQTYSPVYRFEPEGMVFARPVTVTLPLPAGVSQASIYWSRLGAAGLIAIGGTIDPTARTITAQTPHFSLAVVGAASPTRTVNGVGQITWESATTRDSIPMDFATQSVEALVLDASGRRVPIPGSAGPQGTFTIPNVPVGEYILHSGTQYLVTSTNSPDLGYVMGGMPPQGTATRHPRTILTKPSIISFSISNLAAWQNGDQLEWFSTEVDDWDIRTDRLLALAPGATGFSLAADVSQIDAPPPSGPALISTTVGDHVFVAQLSRKTSTTGVPYVAMSRIAQLSPIDMVAGGSVSAGGTMSDVSAANVIALDYRGTQWDAALAAGNPAQTTCLDYQGCAFIGVLAQGGSAQDGFYTANADLLLLDNPVGNLLTGTMTYGSPSAASLSGSWGVMFDVRKDKRVIHQLPGATSGWWFGSGVEWVTTVAAAQAGPLAPPITMPTAIKVGSADFFAGGPGMGLTPTLQWTAPSTNNAVFYDLVVFELYADASNQTQRRTAAYLVTPNLSLTLPAGILQTGKTYVFKLEAVASTSAAGNTAALLASAPYKRGMELATSRTVSGMFMP